MFSASFVTTVMLALSAAAIPLVQIRNSPITLPITRRVNVTSAHNLLRHDRARAKALKACAEAIRGGASFEEAAIVNQPLNNQAIVYTATVGVGSPVTLYDLVIDTGSSNTWVGADKAYTKTSTSLNTGALVCHTGIEYLDTVTLGSLSITEQSIGVASSSSGFTGTDGILGIGPVDLTQGTLSPNVNEVIPTVTDNLFRSGAIGADQVSISFEPTNSEDIVNGEVTWGGTDSSKFTGSINFIPLTTTAKSNMYWGIDQSVRYGASTNILSTTAGIVDTGTTLTLLASDAIARYQSATGAVLDSNTGLLRITAAQFANLQSLFFTAGGHTFELTANAQIWPRNLNAVIGGDADSIYLIVADLGSNSGAGFDFINGLTFLERFYSVFDTTNHRVGFATTLLTNATTN